jgi:hypothetical protein
LNVIVGNVEKGHGRRQQKVGKIIGAHWALGARRQGPAVAVAIASESEHWVLKKKTTNLK